MIGLNFDQEKELTFLAGVNSDGTLAATSFWTWNRDTPATFNPTSSDELKWGSPVADTGATVTFAFDPASNWSAAGQNAFTTSLHLWSAAANIGFTPASDASVAELSFVRGSDGMAETRLRSAGVALTNLYPEGRSVARRIAKAWYVPVAYVVGFLALLGLAGWNPSAA